MRSRVPRTTERVYAACSHTCEFARVHATAWASGAQHPGANRPLLRALLPAADILPQLSAADAVRVWEGPYGRVHDFAVGRVAVEIKGTATATVATFEASSLLQLDETQVGRLCLCHYSWHGGSATGETLPELVDSIRENLAAEDATALARFNESLLRSGYLDSQMSLYDTPRLEETRELLFEVREGFPRLRPRDVPAGIVDGSYTVELSACSGFAIDADKLTRTLIGDEL